MKKGLISKTIEELAPLIKNKDLSPVELTEEIISQTDKYNGEINAYISQTSNTARERAKKMEKEIINGNYRGPLHGIPMAMKDNIYFKGEVTTMGSLIHKDYIPKIESTAVSKLRDAGAIFTGKLNMHEYALDATNDNPHYGPVRNPWDLRKIAGGSSGGSGAAVAADMTIASLGTDTGGSVRHPASICGVVGLKPTYGKVSTFGLFPLAWSLDHIGPLTKTVKDAAFLLEGISGYDAKDPTSLETENLSYSSLLTGDVKGLKIGVIEDYYFNNIDSKVEELVRNAIDKFEDMGAEIVEVDLPELKHSDYVQFVTFLSEATTIQHENLQNNLSKFGDAERIQLEFGQLISAQDYLQAQQIRRQINLAFNRVYESVDILIAPTVPSTPPTIGDINLLINNQEVDLLEQCLHLLGPANQTGLPAISIPCGVANGMPVGLQLIGPAFKEEIILNAAYAFEQTNPMNGQKADLTKIKF